MKFSSLSAFIALGLCSSISALPLEALAGGKEHFVDRIKDSNYWRQRPINAECPGPHFKSIWFKDHGFAVMRYCVDKATVIRLPNGDSRARFVNVSYYGENSNVMGGKHFTSYRSSYKLVNCRTGRWNASSGYSVQNKGSESYPPLKGKPGWFIFTWEGKVPESLPRLSTTNGIEMTSVGPKALFLCPNIQRGHV